MGPIGYRCRALTCNPSILGAGKWPSELFYCLMAPGTTPMSVPLIPISYGSERLSGARSIVRQGLRRAADPVLGIRRRNVSVAGRISVKPSTSSSMKGAWEQVPSWTGSKVDHLATAFRETFVEPTNSSPFIMNRATRYLYSGFRAAPIRQDRWLATSDLPVF